MNIAILMCGMAVEAGGGVRIQGLMWKDGLIALGHQVDMISFWEAYNWEKYDAIIILGHFGYFADVIRQLCMHNKKIAVAPIIDPEPGCSKYKFKFMAQYLRVLERFGLSSNYIHLYNGSKYAKLFLTRSKIETEYLSYSCNISTNRIKQVPLSLRFKPEIPKNEKEEFCFHVSRLSAPNKNVLRLIAAAKKYQFNLKLAGVLHGEIEINWLNSLISDSPNIEYVGELTDSELISYYKRAKVFALPSTIEGVGMVALEAAGFGCEVVLTDIEGPKDYFDGRAVLVNPYDIDSIGKAIVYCLFVGKSQPELYNYIVDNYTIEACSKKLEGALKDL